MGPSSKPIVSCKLTPGKAKQVQSALDLLAQHYAPVLAAWGSLTPEQRAQALAHSPVLARLVEMVRPVVEAEAWRR